MSINAVPALKGLIQVLLYFDLQHLIYCAKSIFFGESCISCSAFLGFKIKGKGDTIFFSGLFLALINLFLSKQARLGEVN